MLITVLIVIAVLLALILFTIAGANPNAFWTGVGWILMLAVIGGVLVGGYYGVRWMLADDIGPIILITTVFGLIAISALYFVWENRQVILEAAIFIALLILMPATAFLLLFGPAYLVGADAIYEGLSFLLGFVAAIPAIVASIFLSSAISARLRSGTSVVDRTKWGDTE